MVSPNVDRILQEAKSLTLDERQQFIELLQAQPAPLQPQSPEDQLAETLFRQGVIRKIPRKPTAEDIARFNEWKPIKVEGRPVSETLIEERRRP